MTTPVVTAQYTPEDLLALPDEKSYELVDGELVERNMGSESSWSGGNLFGILRSFVTSNDRGWVFPADTGYQCFPNSPNKVRKPDVSFIAIGRLPDERLPRGYTPIAPDLAVEVVSPNDVVEELDRKVEEYLDAGVPVVWVANPATRTVMIYRGDGSSTRLREEEELIGEGPLDGFRCRVAEIFPPNGSGAASESD